MKTSVVRTRPWRCRCAAPYHIETACAAALTSRSRGGCACPVHARAAATQFRVYFQEYTAGPKPTHVQTSRSDWGIGADGDHAEYDVPRCAAGTPAAECTHTITGTWMPIAAASTKTHLVLMHAHCHAPTCLKVRSSRPCCGDCPSSGSPPIHPFASHAGRNVRSGLEQTEVCAASLV